MRVFHIRTLSMFLLPVPALTVRVPGSRIKINLLLRSAVWGDETEDNDDGGNELRLTAGNYRSLRNLPPSGAGVESNIADSIWSAREIPPTQGERSGRYDSDVRGGIQDLAQ